MTGRHPQSVGLYPGVLFADSLQGNCGHDDDQPVGLYHGILFDQDHCGHEGS